jgi:pyruvate kinase
MRRAKIVATFGPAVASYDKTLAVIEAGVDVARMNMSHGDYTVHDNTYINVRKAAAELGRTVAVMADLQGPKIRLGRFTDGPHTLAAGDTFTITTDDVEGNAQLCSTTHKNLPQDVRPGDTLLIDDGKVALRAVEVTANNVVTEVTVAGTVSNNKGINLPGVAVNVPALSRKDEEDLRWAIRRGADFIALSLLMTQRSGTGSSPTNCRPWASAPGRTGSSGCAAASGSGPSSPRSAVSAARPAHRATRTSWTRTSLPRHRTNCG